MISQSLAPSRLRVPTHALLAAVPPLAAGLFGLGLLFHEEVAAALTIWLGSTAYNHCVLVIPIAAYLIWDRRAALSGLAPRPVPLLALAAGPLSLAWLLAERIGFMEGRQLVALSGVELLFLAVLGRQAFAALCGPLLYLYFLVPFGGFLTPALQDFTARFVMHGLDLLGVANYTDGYTIQIPEGTFYVAGACAGLRFLTASTAFGSLYALLMYRTPLRRAAFIAASVVLPVLANGVRALGIVLLGHALGSAQAVEADHILYGWIFFSIVILALILLGLPFREDPLRADVGRWPPPGGSAAPRVLGGTAAGVLMGCMIGPLAALALTLAPAPVGTSLDLATAGCRADPEPAQGAPPAQATVRRYACGGLVLQAEMFSPAAPARLILREWARLTQAPDAEDVATWRLRRHGLPWTLTQTSQPARLTAALLWQGGPVEPGLRFRLHQAWRSVLGGGQVPVLVVLTLAHAEPGINGDRRATLALASFLDAEAERIAAALDAVSPTQ